jgi:hypothetical protein
MQEIWSGKRKALKANQVVAVRAKNFDRLRVEDFLKMIVANGHELYLPTPKYRSVLSDFKETG